jgi:hypothetical protein
VVGQATRQGWLQERQRLGVAPLVDRYLATLDAKLRGPQYAGGLADRRSAACLGVSLDEFARNEALLNGAIEFFRIALLSPTSLDGKQQNGSKQSYGMVVPLEKTVPPVTPPCAMLPISARTMVNCAEKRLTSSSPRKMLPKSGTLMMWQ